VDWSAEVPLAHGADALSESRDLRTPRLPDRGRFTRPEALYDDARHALNVSHQLAFSLPVRGVHHGAASTAQTVPGGATPRQRA
jgi:hypothetical protein